MPSDRAISCHQIGPKHAEELDKNGVTSPVSGCCSSYRRKPSWTSFLTPTVYQGASTVRSGRNHPGGRSAFAGPIVAARRSPRRPARREGPRIAAVAVSDSHELVSQRQVLDRLGLAGDEFAERIFARSGVRQRHLELSDELLDGSLQGRGAWIEDDLMRHSIHAVDALGIDPAQIGTVLSASLYSLGGPTLAHRLVDHFRMDAATDKYHVNGVGCASGVPLMRLASQALQADPERDALIVAAESMSGIMTRASDADPRAKTVGAAIFGDGCAAALLSFDARADGPSILASQVHQIAGTLDAVSMRYSEEDTYLHLARELPDLAGTGLAEVVERFLRRNHLRRSQIDHWILHPGGRRIVENMQAALELSDEDTALSWSVLAEHGNVGTPSIFYVLKDTEEQRAPEPGQHGLMVTIGPGVTVGVMLLGW
jgi:predicted naringenin-chalcone synthase